MPNRLIREGLLDSDSVDALSADGERFFTRLILAADDAGRISARPETLRARLFPIKADVTHDYLSKMVDECADRGLVIPYNWDGKAYLQLTRVHRCGKGMTSKYPWRDGTFKFEFVKRETRDGVKEFVDTSLPHADGIATPSAPHTDGMDYPLRPMHRSSPETGTETESKTIKAKVLDKAEDLDSQDSKVVPIRSDVTECPHQAIIDLYHSELPELPQIREWAGKREQALRSRWREAADRQNLDWWREFFRYVKESDFLMGRTNGPRGPFTGCNLEWLVTHSHFVNVIEGKYHREAAHG